MAPALYDTPDDSPDPTLVPDYDNHSTPVDDNSVTTEVEPAPMAYRRSAPKMRIMWQDDLRLIGRFSQEKDRLNIPDDKWKMIHDVTPANGEPKATYLQRMVQGGATDVRFIVYWAAWMNDVPGHENGYRDAVTSAVDAAASVGLAPYVTLTGGDSDDTLNGQPTNVFEADGMGGFNANSDVTTTAYAAFVRNVVGTLKTHGAHQYAIWNEPNLNGRTFLGLKCPNKPIKYHRLTADLYRAIYKAGYAAVSATDKTARIFIGELAHTAELGRVACGDPTNKPGGLRTDAFLKEVANSSSDPLRTYGVAWHPYQPQDAPNSKAIP